MKHIFLLTFLVGLSMSGRAQEVVIDTNYYAPPPVVRERVLTEDPDNNPKSDQMVASQSETDVSCSTNSMKYKPGMWAPKPVSDSDGSVLSNSLDRLVSNPTPTKASWSALLGYTYHNAWTIEAGYTRAPYSPEHQHCQ